MNNNPFEPVTTDPSVDPPLTDNAADDFTAGDDIDGGQDGLDGAPKAPLSIDGISPNYGADNNAMGDDGDVSNVTLVGSGETDNAPQPTDMLTDDHSGDFLANLVPSDDDSLTANNTTEPAKDDSTAPTDETPLVAPAPVKGKDKKDKPTKHVTISLLTIIFLILAIAGIAGTVWFYLQNSKNTDALADANAKIAQLEDKASTTATVENTGSGQYDGLQDKIKELNTQNDEKQKKLDENKKSIDDLTKKNTDLTTQLAEQTKKATDISTLTTRVDTMLKKLDDIMVP